MSEMIDTIVEVARFADAKAGDLHTGFQCVAFRPFEVSACGYAGGIVAAIDLDIGEVVVSAARLLKVLKAMPDAVLDVVEVSGKQRLQMAQGGGVASLDLLPTNQAIKLSRPGKKAGWVEVHGLDEVERVSWSGLRNDASRLNLSGIAFGAFGIATTNGHSAALLGTPGDMVKELGREVLAPPDMLRGLPEVTNVALDGERMFIAEDPTAGDFRVVNLFNATLPPVVHLLTSALEKPQMQVPKAPFEEMLKRARLSDTTVTLSVEGKRLQVSVDQADAHLSLFDYAESVAFEVAGKSIPAGKIRLDLRYLLPAVQAVKSEQITVHLLPEEEGSVEPMTLVDGPYCAIIMPMRA